MSEQTTRRPKRRHPFIQADDWEALKRRAEYPSALAAVTWSYQDGYRRAMLDSHEANLALGTPQPPEEGR